MIRDGDGAFHTRLGSFLQAPVSPSNSIHSISSKVNALNTDYGRSLQPPIKRSIALTLLAGLIFAVVPALSAAIPQWPQFRGPNGSGLPPDENPDR